MQTLLVALEEYALLVRGDGTAWRPSRVLDACAPRAFAADSGGALYCGTWGHGVWRSSDGGTTWAACGGAIGAARVMAVAAAGVVVYCGTEPSALWRSEDGGANWQPLPAFARLPSAANWSFPPRPETHHVRCIVADPHDPATLHVAVEAGALVRSRDGGASWIDRVPGSPIDTHTLLTHPHAPGRLYAAAGDGYFESRDGGETWERPRDGLAHDYMWSVVAHDAEPERRVVSAASGPRTAHDAARAESFVYRRDRHTEWERCADGLPPATGTTVPVLAHDAVEPDTLWLASNHGIFVTRDFGTIWRPLAVAWPDTARGQRVKALLAR